MVNNLQLFNYKGKSVRAIWFEEKQDWIYPLVDICNCAGIENVSNVVKRLWQDGVHTVEVIDRLGRLQQTTCISLSNCFLALMQSRKSEAEPFQRWVCEEVLPAIFKTGSYSIHDKSPKEQLKDELGMLQFVHKVVHAVFIALSRKWIVAHRQRARYAKVAFDYFRLEVIRADRAFTEVAKWHCGEDVFNDLNIKGDIAKMKAEIRNGEEVEVQIQLPFDENEESA